MGRRFSRQPHLFIDSVFGLCALVPHGATCRLITVIGARFIRWRDNGVWERLMEILIDEPDYEWLMIDASH